ncbi:MAG: VOC family protein [Gemmatimonadota bacterium]
MAHGIPKGFHTVTPYLTIRDASAAIAFYQRAFGAEEEFRHAGPDGRLIHARIRIGDSLVMLSEEFLEWGAKSPLAFDGSPVTLHIYSEDVDAAWERAVTAGATITMPLDNQFWGDRYGQVKDPYGHNWSLAQHLEDLSPEETNRRAAEAFSQMGDGPPDAK